MPNYIFQCDGPGCTHQIEEMLSIANRDTLVGCPCEVCGTGKLTRPFGLNSPSALSVDASIDAHQSKATGGFREAIQRVSNSMGVKGTKYADRLKSRFL